MLTAKKVERAKKPGRYRCGLVKGLLLQVTDTGARSWVLRYELRGRERWMGLGSASEFSLKEARERARQARQLLADRIDPLAGKRTAEQAQRLQDARRLSFAQAAQQYFDQHEKRWRNVGHREEFLRSLRDYHSRSSARRTWRRSIRQTFCGLLKASGKPNLSLLIAPEPASSR